jgi:hypothetical protein
MAQELTEFIASIRLAESIEHERFIIKSEQADIRSYIRECEPELRPRLVAKLLFLGILGESVAYGQIESINLMSTDRFSYKRLGYIATAVLLDEASELSVLITNALKKDLTSADLKVQCLALTLLANIRSVEMCQSLASVVLRLCNSKSPAVMKRAAMAAVRVVQRVRDLAETFKPAVNRLLKHGAHGVVISAINLMVNIICVEPSYRTNWTRYTTAFTKILR